MIGVTFWLSRATRRVELPQCGDVRSPPKLIVSLRLMLNMIPANVEAFSRSTRHRQSHLG
jgi:hypothetical protein